MDQEIAQVSACKTLIIPFGDLGVTQKAAEKLSAFLGEGNAEIAKTPPKELLGYHNYVLGMNVRFGKLNKRFRKYVKRNLEALERLPVYLFVVGVEIENSKKYISLAKKALPSAREIRYVWGELNLEGASAFERFFIKCYIDGRRGDKLPKPRLLDKEIRGLADLIR